MSVVILQVFVTLLLVAGGVTLFVYSATQKDIDHCDRLSLLPLEEDSTPKTVSPVESKP